MTIALATVASGCVSVLVPVDFAPGFGFADGTPSMLAVFGAGAGEGVEPPLAVIGARAMSASIGASMAGAPAATLAAGYAAIGASGEAAQATIEKEAAIATSALVRAFMGIERTQGFGLTPVDL